ncbi:MAG: HIT family protein [Opitutales bacterium]|nr:HIT family protein [Opitutales bacterium]
MPSIFTRILRGEAPASIVQRDTVVAVFLDIAPLSEGHCLVVPVQETAHLADLPPQTLVHFICALCAICGSKSRAQGKFHRRFLRERRYSSTASNPRPPHPPPAECP